MTKTGINEKIDDRRKNNIPLKYGNSNRVSQHEISRKKQNKMQKYLRFNIKQFAAVTNI